MKKTPIDQSKIFRGSLRHYHRSGAKRLRPWDDWIDGKPRRKKKPMVGLIVAGLAIASLVVWGLIYLIL